VAGSRTATSRPRRVAGSVPPVEHPPVEPPPATEPSYDEQPASRPLLGRLGTTLALVVALVLLVGVAAGESWYLWLRDEPVVSSARPVVTGEMAHRSAVEAASQDIEQILSTSYKNYDEQVDQATSKMTEAFGKQYRETSDQIEADFVKARTEVQSQVVAASVMRASSEQVEALLFVNQAVAKKGETTGVSQYRVRLTMVHTDHGWLVSDIQTS
jgi:Mce-associated membrane protein